MSPARRATATRTGAGGALRSSLVVAAGTALSRVTGFGRLVVLAATLGFTSLTDAYNLANNTPTILYELVLGGVLSGALVPLFVDTAERGDDEATDAVVTVASLALLALALAGMVASPLIVALYTAGDAGSDVDLQRQVATALLVLFQPQILFYGLSALATALLQARRRFAAPAFAPVLNNVVVIAILVATPIVAGTTPQLDDAATDPRLVWLLGLGTTAGIVAMTVVLWPALRRAGVRLHWRPRFRHPAVHRLLRLSGWTIGYVAANQVSLFVVTALALDLEGGVSAYQAAYLVMILPYSLFALSLATTFAPELASSAAAGHRPAFRRDFRTGWRFTVVAMVPAAAGLVVLARPLVEAVLGWGALDPESAALTAEVLRALAVSLPFLALYLFCVRGFFAFGDTRTPFLINVGQNALNVVLAFALWPVAGVTGLGWAWTLAYVPAPLVAAGLLARRSGTLGRFTLAAVALRPLLAGAAMAAAVAATVAATARLPLTGQPLAVVQTLAGAAVGIGVYLAGLAALRTPELTLLAALARRRRPAAPVPA